MHAVKLAAMGLGVILLISGCAATPAPAAKSTVGQCWQADPSAPAPHIGDQAKTTVACSAVTSTAYTYVVGTVQGAPAHSYLSDGFLAATTIAALPENLRRHISNECGAGLLALFPGSSALSLGHLRVVSGVSFPSVAQWNEGERWFSCELSLRQVGSSLTKPTWETLPTPIADLVAAVTTAPQDYRLCVDTASNSISPEASSGVVANCASARWAVRPASLGVTYGQIYPGPIKAKALATRTCKASNPGALAIIVPSVSNLDWETTDPWVACWVSTKPDTAPVPTPEATTPTPSPTPRRVVPNPGVQDPATTDTAPLDTVPIDPGPTDTGAPAPTPSDPAVSSTPAG